MNYPSHANSSVGQVANAYMGNPQALQQRTQPQNGVTPELIDLLALQKLQADKDAAARQMALQSGQTPPTVAQGLEQSAMQSARQEIAQKLGLPGLMNQGQNVPQAPGAQPQGAPQAPQAQGPQPMQRMAAGGLARLPSNLPQNYAGGGIIAFGEQDGEQLVPPAPALQDLEFDSEGLPRSASEKARIISDNAIVQKRIAAMGQEATQKSIAKNQYDAQTSGLAERMQDYYKPRGTAQAQPDVMEQLAAELAKRPPAPSVLESGLDANGHRVFVPNAQGDIRQALAGVLDIRDPVDRTTALAQFEKQFGKAAVNSAAEQLDTGDGPAINAASGRTRLPAVASGTQPPATKPGAQPVATNTQPPVSGIDKILSYAKTSPVQGPVEQSVIRSVSQDADTTPVTREAARQKIIGPSQTAAIEAQQQGLANTAAGQAAIKAARPSDWQTWLQAVGSNLHNGSGLGGATAGVASAMDKARMGYATENATQQAKLDTLNQAMKDALAQNDIGRANAIDKQRTDVEANIRAGQTAGASMVATTATENARVESTLARFEQAQQVAQQNNDTKLQNTLAGIDARITKAASDQAAAQAKTIPGMMDADIPALAAKIRAQMLATDPSYNAVMKKLGIEAPLPTPTATAAPTMRYNSATKKLEAV